MDLEISHPWFQRTQIEKISIGKEWNHVNSFTNPWFQRRTRWMKQQIPTEEKS